DYVQDEVGDVLGVGGDHRAHLALVDALDDAVHHKGLADQAQETVQAAGDPEDQGRAADDQHVAGHQGGADVQGRMPGQDHGNNISAAGGSADVEHNGAANGRQQHRKDQLQQGVVGKRGGHGTDGV